MKSIQQLIKKTIENSQLSSKDWHFLSTCFKENPDHTLQSIFEHDAVKLLAQLLKKKPGVIRYTTPRAELSLVHLAASLGAYNILTLLLETYHLPANAICDDGYDYLADALPLHYAASYDHTDCVALLIDHYPEGAHTEDYCGLTPLQQAVMHRAYGAIEQLLSCTNPAGAYSSYRDRFWSEKEVRSNTYPMGCTALGIAVMRNDIRAMRLFLNSDHCETLYYVIDNYDEDENDDEDIPIKNGTLLHWAILHHADDALTVLLETSPFLINEPDDVGVTPLHLAIKTKNFTALKRLLGHVLIDLNVVDDESNTPLHYLSETYKDSDIDRALLKAVYTVVKTSQEHDRLANIINAEGDTALLVACRNNQTFLAYYLMYFPGATYDQEDTHGITAFGYAVKHNNHELIQRFKHRPHLNPNHTIKDSGKKLFRSETKHMLIDEFGEGCPLSDEVFADTLYDILCPEAEKTSEAFESYNDEDEGKDYMDIAMTKSHAVLRTMTSLKQVPTTQLNKQVSDQKRQEILDKAAQKRKLDEQYTSEGSDSDNSDFEPDPAPLLVPTSKAPLKPLPKGTALIPHFRGEAYATSFWTKARRREDKQHIRRQSRRGLHSLATYNLAQANPTEAELTAISKDVNQATQLFFNQPYPGKPGKSCTHQTEGDADLHQFINRYANYKDELVTAVTGNAPQPHAKIDPDNIERFKRANFPSSQHPHLSTSDLPSASLKFGYNIAITYSCDQNMLRIRADGTVKRPDQGRFFVILHTQDELTASGALHAPTLKHLGRIGIQQPYMGSRETRFSGGIPAEHITLQLKLKIPDLNEYLPLYKDKYGLSKKRFLAFKKDILETAELSDARKNEIKKLMGYICKHLDKQILEAAKQLADQKNGELKFQDFLGGLCDKAPPITMLYNKKQHTQSDRPKTSKAKRLKNSPKADLESTAQTNNHGFKP